MSKRSQQYKRARRRMYAENPHCPDCGVVMIEPETLPGYLTGKIRYFPDNTCTYEHVNSRLSEKRGTEQYVNRILCKKCNEVRGNRETESLDIETLRERSKRHGRKKITNNQNKMDRQQYEEDLRKRQAEHLARVSQNMDRNWRPCMHDACPECHGTGIKINGGTCVHMISCPCPKCTPVCM